jgi:hypothetical protein
LLLTSATVSGLKNLLQKLKARVVPQIVSDERHFLLFGKILYLVASLLLMALDAGGFELLG